MFTEDTWTTGRIETDGKTVTIEAVEGTDNLEPSYAAVDDIIFINDVTCETKPTGAAVGGGGGTTTSTSQHQGDCIDCKDGSGR